MQIKNHNADYVNRATTWRKDISDKESEESRCEECRVYWGGHTLECSKISLEDALYQAKFWRDLHKHNKSAREIRIAALKKEVALYQAKFLQVKNENNQMRKKLYEQND